MKVPVAQFCEAYDISYQSLLSMKCQNKYPEHIFSKSGQYIYVDEAYFVRRWEFSIKVKLSNQDLYALLSLYFPIIEIARAIKSYTKISSTEREISTHLREDTFMVGEGLNKTRISSIKWAIFRYWWAIERRLKRKGTSIAKILDRRINASNK